jgi:SPP1 gp7 family putative phage head morphogenesis protein
LGYWDRRQAREMYEYMESAEDASKEIADIYAKASRELNLQIEKTYERFRDKYNMTDEAATKLLNSMEDATDLDELKQRLAGLKGKEARKILREMESPAYRARIERLQKLQEEIDRKMKEVYRQEKQVSTSHYIDQYKDSYYHEVYDLKRRTGLDYSFGAVDEKQLNRTLHTNWSGANYSQRIWGNTQGLAKDLKTQLALAYLTGKTERDIATETAKKYSTGAANARRLVRTESAYISGQAQAAADRDAGIDRYRILATLDLRTSEICREMDGQEFAYKDMQVGTNYPPFHPYCRTTVLSVLDDQDMSKLQRRSRDPQTGKTKKFKGDITYEDWYNMEIKGNKTIEKSVNSDIIKEDGSLLEMDLQLFAEKDIKNQGSASLKRAIRKYEKQIKEHEQKLSNPEEYADDWNTKSPRQQEGLKRHWMKENRNFRQSIQDRIDELKERGDYDGK